ncbi:MAG: metallophosphoesterase [Bradymonadia bacterium]
MSLRYILFASILVVLLVSVHLLIYRRLIRDVQPRKALLRVGAVFLALMCAGTLGGIVFSRFFGGGETTAFVTYTWFGVVSLALMVLLPIEVGRLLFRIVRRLRGKRGDEGLPDPQRRLALTRGAATVTALGVGGAAAAGVSTALSPPRLQRITVPIDNLPPAFEGFTIAQVSDIHVGPTIKGDFIRDLVSRINALNVDMVAITGDLVDGSVSQLGEHVAPLGELKSAHGTFFCTGNHEYYSGVTSWMRFLTSLGIEVLGNRRMEITRDGAALDVIGVHDWMSRGPGHGHDLAGAIAGRDASRPSILLAHQPRAIHDATDKGMSLVLSGHTHGGQLWPFRFIVGLVQPYVQGLHKHRDKTWIYVHPGTGYWGPPMRVGVPAEIAVITLTAGQKVG